MKQEKYGFLELIQFKILVFFLLCYSIAMNFGEKVEVSFRGIIYQLQARLNGEFKSLQGLAISDGSTTCVNFSSTGSINSDQNGFSKQIQQLTEKVELFENHLLRMKEEIQVLIQKEISKAINDVAKNMTPPCSPRSPRSTATITRKPPLNLGSQNEDQKQSLRAKPFPQPSIQTATKPTKQPFSRQPTEIDFQFENQKEIDRFSYDGSNDIKLKQNFVPSNQVKVEISHNSFSSFHSSL